MVTCVPCPPGVSFSDKHDTSSCTSCSSCAEDQVVLRNCTSEWDIKCEKRCHSKKRYYDNDKGDCFPCSKCCQDDQDVVADECKQKMGAGSNMVCSFDSSVNRCDQSTPSPLKPTTITNQGKTTNDASSPSQGSEHQHTVPPTAQTRHHLSTTEIAVVVLSVLVALLIFGGCLYRARQKFRYPCCSGDTETGITDPVNSASQSCMVHDKPTEDNLDAVVKKGLTKDDKVSNCGVVSTESMEPLLGKGFTQEDLECSCQQESKLLNSLLDCEDDLQEISVRLDTTMAGVGNYKAVAQHYGLSYYKIASVLEKHERGPTTALIECLAATIPEVTVREFAAVVREKAKRKDVVEWLEAYDSNTKCKIN